MNWKLTAPPLPTLLILSSADSHYSEVTFFTGDITFPEDIETAIQKSDATCVIHTASPVHGLGAEIYKKVNVLGTQTVIDACLAHNVPKLVYTSSAGVVYNGEEDIVDVDERMDYPEAALDAYNETKALAEAMVLKANGVGGLLTCALRPAGIFGPGDRQGLPAYKTVIDNGQTKFQIGSNDNLFDFTYVGNVAHAHLLAADRLDDVISPFDFSYPLPDVTLSTGNYRVPTSKAHPIGPQQNPTEEEKLAAKAFETPIDTTREDDLDLQPVLRTKMDQFSKAAQAAAVAEQQELEKQAGVDADAAEEKKKSMSALLSSEKIPNELAVAGQAFFITNCEPVYFWDFARTIWKGLGHIPSGRITLPPSIGMVLAELAELYSKITGKEAGFTRFRVKFATQKRYYNVERARRLLGYEPIVGVEDGIRRTIDWYNAEQAKKITN